MEGKGVEIGEDLLSTGDLNLSCNCEIKKNAIWDQR